MIVAIHQPHYLPWLRYFHKIASCDVFVLLDDAQFTKNGWQNRNKIKGAQGPLLLTVPVRDASFKPIDQVEIDNQTPWGEKHWKSLLSYYRKAPYFHSYSGIFEQMLARRWDRLSLLNCQFTAQLCQAIGIRTPMILSSALGIPGKNTERLAKICQYLGATHYLTGAYAASNHLDMQAFADAGIQVVKQAWTAPTYRQQFPSLGFLPELAVADLLFNEGPNSLHLLLSGVMESRHELIAAPA